MKRFEGKSVILSGGASGIGAATARYFAKEGANLLILDRSPAVSDVAAEIGATALVCDLTEDAAPGTVATRAKYLFGNVDALLNIAGIGGRRSLAETSDQFFDNVMNVNLRSVVRLTREISPLLRRPGSVIINTSSTLGLAGQPNLLAYGVSKGAINQLTRQLAADLGPEGIRVNAVAPGVIETPMTAERVSNDPNYQRAFIENAALRSYGAPEDIASAVAFLASDEARFISGQVLVVDGGWLDARHLPRVE